MNTIVKKTVYSMELEVLVSHMNYANHLGYDSVLSIIQDARMRWLKANNMSEISIDNHIGYLVVEAHARYKNEAYFGDRLVIEVFINNVTKKTFELSYIIKTENKEIAECSTKHIFFDNKCKRVVSMPDNFKKIISPY